MIGRGGAFVAKSSLEARLPIPTSREVRSSILMGGAKRAPSVTHVLRCAAKRLKEGGVDSYRLDAELLLMNVLGWSKEDLYRNPEVVLQAPQVEGFKSLVSRRVRAEPVAYITGTKAFWSLDFRVTPDVLIPRPETEHLVEAVLDFIALRSDPCRILEIGTGSGAVAVCLAKECARAQVWATDISAAALDVARENAVRHGVDERIRWGQGDLFSPVPELLAGFDVLVSNPPYIASSKILQLQRNVRDWEPMLALDGGIDGMEFFRRLVRGGVRYLRAGGVLAVEVGAEQGIEVSRMFRAEGRIHRVRLRQDYAGLPRVVTAERVPGG